MHSPVKFHRSCKVFKVIETATEIEKLLDHETWPKLFAYVSSSIDVITITNIPQKNFIHLLL